MVLSEQHQMIRDALRAFSQERLLPNAARWDKEHHFPKQELAELAALGAFGVAVPEELGGAGLDYVSLALVLEEIAAGDGGTSTVISVNNCPVCSIAMMYANDAQKEQFLKPLASQVLYPKRLGKADEIAQLAQHIGFAPAQLDRPQLREQVARRGTATRRRRRRDELQEGGQLVEAVLQRRAGERPRAAAAEQLALAADFRFAVLDPLRLVEDHQVPQPPAGRRVRAITAVFAERLITGQVDVGRRAPLPGALFRRAAHGGETQLRRPVPQRLAPLGQQTGRRQQQA